MTIELYTGFVGSGKSFHAVRRGTLKADAPYGKGEVVANFPIKPKKKLFARWRKEKFNKPRWTFVDNDQLTPEYLVKYSYDWQKRNNRDDVPEGQFLLIIDECGILFNSRDWNVKGELRKEWIKFFTQSRKLGYDCVLIVQDNRMLDRQIRSLAEYEVQHKKMNGWGLLSLLPITIFAGVKFWNGIRNVRGSLEMTIYNKALADRYDTKALFGYGSEYEA